jgi:hypothetical protein
MNVRSLYKVVGVNSPLLCASYFGHIIPGKLNELLQVVYYKIHLTINSWRALGTCTHSKHFVYIKSFNLQNNFMKWVL